MSSSPAVEKVTVVSEPATAPASTTQTTIVQESTKPTLTATKTPDDLAVALDYKSAHLKLDVATHEEALHQSKRNAISWKGPLHVEAYLRREAHLASQAFTREGGLTPWVLVSTAAEPSQRRVLAGCETYRKRALLVQDGEIREVTAHGIGSVFVPEEHRGKKYGERMMMELGEKLRTWKTEHYPCLFSVLYSDIGKSYYSRLGWVPFPSSHIHIRPESSSMLWEKHGSVEPLHMTDLPKICAWDEELIRKRMAKYKQGTAVALIPDYKTIEWHHAREEFVANELFGKAPYVKGARAEVNGHKVWAIWTRVFGTGDMINTKGNTLHILRILVEEAPLDIDSSDFHPDHIAGIASVLRVAQKEAAEWHMHEIEIWNPHPRTLAAAQSVDPTCQLIHRDSESIASLKWYGDSDVSVDWLEADKSGWC